VFTSRNSEREIFLACRKKYQLSRKWESRIKDYNLALGTVVHAALPVWDLTRSQDKTLEEIIRASERENVEEKEVLLEEATSLVLGYIEKWQGNYLTLISTEVKFEGIELAKGIGNTGTLDGLTEKGGSYWIVERKTSGGALGQFLKKYDLDSQTTGYAVLAEKEFKLVIKGVCLDVLLKVNGKRPDAEFHREWIEISELKKEEWLLTTLRISADMQRAQQEDAYYPNWGACFNYYGTCPYWDYCRMENNEKVLESTHRRKVNG